MVKVGKAGMKAEEQIPNRMQLGGEVLEKAVQKNMRRLQDCPHLSISEVAEKG